MKNYPIRKYKPIWINKPEVQHLLKLHGSTARRIEQLEQREERLLREIEMAFEQKDRKIK